MMEKLVRFTVTIRVNDEGQLDETALGKAISDGIDKAQSEGAMTDLEDTTTEVLHWRVTHHETTMVDTNRVE